MGETQEERDRLARKRENEKIKKEKDVSEKHYHLVQQFDLFFFEVFFSFDFDIEEGKIKSKHILYIFNIMW